MKTRYLIIAVLFAGILFPPITFSQRVNVQGDTGRALPMEPEYETRPFQFTFLFPPLSTNGYENANIVNNLSLNLFTGISGGVDGVDLGGFINVDRFFMHGFQAAGFGNVVGGDAEGLQFAGFYNVNGGNTRYVQGAGFINVTGLDQYGIQGAGFANVVGGRMAGLQGAGFINVAGGRVTGVQGAGFLNVAGNSGNAVQAAGFGNVAGNGVVNVQASGFFNVADTVSGLQAAGFMNTAGHVKGLMAAGFINVCDSIDGIPIGFINIVRKNGYRRFELATSETNMVSFSFRMGVERLYSIYHVAKAYGPLDFWVYGIGLGSQFGIGERSYLNVEAMANHEIRIAFGEPFYFYFYHPAINMHNQLRLAYGYRIGNRFELFAGPTLNVGISNVSDAYDIEPLAPGWARSLDVSSNSIETSLWVGVRGGIRF